MTVDGTGSIDESTIGRTPLIELFVDVPATVLAKVEWLNLYALPHGGGSVKSRIAKAMLDAAEDAGTLKSGTTIIEPSSGNTGSEIARIGCARGYDVEIVMPDNASGGKIDAVRDAGGDIHFVDADRGYDAVIEECDRLVAASPDRYYRPNQYENPHNPGAHEATTAPEIWDATDGSVTHLVAGVGTGGTVTGTGRGLTDRGDVTVVGFEPGEALHAIDGLKYLRTGEHYHPGTYDESVLDATVYVDTDDAYRCARALRDSSADREIPIRDVGQHDVGLIRRHLRVGGQFVVGTSSGAAVAAVEQYDEEHGLAADDIVTVIFADRGDKYANIPLWQEYL